MQEIITRAVGYTLLHSLWQGLLLAGGPGILMTLTKQSSSATRYKMLCSLLIVFIGMVAYTFYRQVIVALNTDVSSRVIVYNAERWPVSDNIINTAPGFAGYLQQAITIATSYFNRYSGLLVLLWFFIFLFHFTKLLVGMMNAERMRYYKTSLVPEEWNYKMEQLCRRLQISKPVLLMESALLKVPVLVGYIKPVVLVPIGMLAQLPAEQAEAILLHELAHVRRHDYLVNLVQHAIDTLFFFNPGILWISSLVRNERENCCDDMAIRETKSRKQFIEALVSFNHYSNTLSTCSLSWITGKSQLLQRVQRIVNRKNPGLRSAEMMVLLALLLLTGTAFIAARRGRQNVAQASKHAVVQPQEIHKPDKIAIKPLGAEALSSIHSIKQMPAMKAIRITNPVIAPIITRVAPVADAMPVVVPAIAEPASGELASLQKQLAALGYHENNLDKLQEYTDHGVSPEYIKSMLDAGFSNVTLDQIQRLRDHGVHAAFVSGLKKEGYGNTGLEKVIMLVDHGVTINFIESIRQLGFTNISLEDAITLKDHGVSSAFIASFTKRTGHLLPLEDYIKLRDSGISPV